MTFSAQAHYLGIGINKNIFVGSIVCFVTELSQKPLLHHSLKSINPFLVPEFRFGLHNLFRKPECK